MHKFKAERLDSILWEDNYAMNRLPGNDPYTPGFLQYGSHIPDPGVIVTDAWGNTLEHNYSNTTDKYIVKKQGDPTPIYSGNDSAAAEAAMRSLYP